MINEVAEALANQDILRATQLLDSFSPDDPWVQYYQGQLAEIRGEWERAEEIYKQLLRIDHGSKLTFSIRKGLDRVKSLRQAQPQPAQAQAAPTPEHQALGVLILEPIHPEARQEAAKAFAQVMNLEVYAARLLLPSRGWRLYRVGSGSELERYVEALQAQGIASFWMPLAQVQSPQILQVNYFEAFTPNARAMCSHLGEQPFPFEFAWSAVSQRVEGLLPIFEQVVDQDIRGKLQRKEQIQDYVQFCDLHLPQQNMILRIYTGAYQFNQGLSLVEEQVDPGTENTSWGNWKGLKVLLDRYLPTVPTWSDFTPFGESLADHEDLLSRIDPQINLFRRQESYWDAAFHLYSCLIFYKSRA